MMRHGEFYRLSSDYDFLLLRAVHFGAYSETAFRQSQERLERAVIQAAGEPAYAAFKPLLLEMYGEVREGKDISRFFPMIMDINRKAMLRQFVRDIPVYAVCLLILGLACILPEIMLPV